MSARKGTVYIIEDDPSFCRSMVRLLRAEGFKVTAYACGNSFLAHAGCGAAWGRERQVLS